MSLDRVPINTAMFKIAAVSMSIVGVLSMTLLPASAAAPNLPTPGTEIQTLTTSDSEVQNLPNDLPTGELLPEPEPEPEPVNRFTAPPNLPPPEPGTAQAYAKDYLSQFGHGESEFSCLVALWNRESGWNYQAMNTSSGAYGIPQALPGNKMASAGDDWETNPETQIRWGIGYINARYGTPCGAWAHSEANNWY